MYEYVKNKWVYFFIVLVIFSMVVWIIAGTINKEESSNVMSEQPTYTMDSTSSIETTEIMNEFKSYYLVRKDETTVNIYWVDETGEHLHKETTIPYALLSNEDQKILEYGVKIYSDDELAGFLENYDS